MFQSFLQFQANFKQKLIKVGNENLERTLYKFNFLFCKKNIIYEENPNNIFTDHSKIIVVDQCQGSVNEYYVICFDYNLIIFRAQKIKYPLDSFFDSFISQHEYSRKYYLNGSINDISNNVNQIFLDEIQSFSSQFVIENTNLKSFWSKIVKCIVGFLIKKSYQNSIIISQNYFNQTFSEFIEEANFRSQNYIRLRKLGKGGSSDVELIYHIKKEELFALKIPNDESLELNEREHRNFTEIRYTYIVQYYGYIQSMKRKMLLLEYIDGQTLNNINTRLLSKNDKYNMIFELMLTIQYIHMKNFIYRDLSIFNIMVNKNNEIILIDFDRLVKPEEQGTFNFTLEFSPPEILSGNNFSTKSDIYLLGTIIYYILFDKKPKFISDSTELKIDLSDLEKNSKERLFFKKCFKIDPSKRPDIGEIIILFYQFLQDIHTKSPKEIDLINLLEFNTEISRDMKCILLLGNIYYNGLYVPRNIKKAIDYYSIAANENNDPEAQLSLGLIYRYGNHNFVDINKAITYFLLASNQNNMDAQFHLAQIYDIGPIPNLKKAFTYYLLAANNGHIFSQFIVAIFYKIGRGGVPYNIQKAIYYLTIVANQSMKKFDDQLHLKYYKLASKIITNAQRFLGELYYNGKQVGKDVPRAKYYFSLAEKNNDEISAFNLGNIYYVKGNLNEAIKYFTIAAQKNHSDAQLSLGVIYLEDERVKQNINKGIYYLTIAANQYNHYALMLLGDLYCKGFYVPKDVNKGINYLILAARKDNKQAQCLLGIIYFDNSIVKQDMNKSIYYFTLAAQKQDKTSLFYLGCIYFEGLYVKYDIHKTIKYFKDASCFDDNYAKNNLGVIYKMGKGVKANIFSAIVYFEEAIKKGDFVAMINLAHIHLYEEVSNSSIDKAIELLINSCKKKKMYVFRDYLLCLALVKKYRRFSILEIRKKIQKICEMHNEIWHFELIMNFTNSDFYNKIYDFLKNVNFVYYGYDIEVFGMKKEKIKNDSFDKRKPINSLFYEGFGISI